MGQIQNSIDSLVTKSIAAAVGKSLEKANAEAERANAEAERANAEAERADAESKAYAAQESATKALEEKAEADRIAATTEAYRDREKGEFESKANKYGQLVESDYKGNKTTVFVPTDDKLSKNKGARKRQLNSVEASQHRLDKAIEANDYARSVADFKTAQYESFKKRVELLAKKAKMDPSTLTDFQKAEEAYKLNVGNRYDMPSDLQEILEGGKKNG